MQQQPKKRPILDFSNAQTMTEQHHADVVKTQNIMKQFQTTGMATHLNNRPPIYEDLSEAPDFYEAQKIIANAKSMFEEVPAQIRREFNHDPGQYLEFIQNPENKDQMEEMGLDTSHFPENWSKPLSKEERDQIHLEEAIEAKIAQKASQSVSEASIEELQAAIAAKTESTEA